MLFVNLCFETVLCALGHIDFLRLVRREIVYAFGLFRFRLSTLAYFLLPDLCVL
jgi:hypothetical protein